MTTFMLLAIPDELRGAVQLVRGPLITEGRLKGWRYAAWLDGDPHPGGWPIKLGRQALEEWPWVEENMALRPDRSLWEKGL